MVCVGESLTLPEACELVDTVRTLEPAVAVMVTEVAFDDCQLSVTLCPLVIVLALAVKVTVGVDGGVVCVELPLEQPLSPHKASNTIPLVIS